MNDISFRIIFIILLIFTGSCYFGDSGGGLSGRVIVYILPYGEGDVIQTQKPRLNYSPQEEEVPCRKEQPNIRSIREIEDLEVIAKLLLGDSEEDEDQDGNQRQNSDEPVEVTVNGGWIQLGLLIDNKNSGVGRNYTLVIDQLQFHWDGNCEREGQGECKGSDTISSGYCDLPFLYLVPSGLKVDYKPLSDNPLHNLVLYVDGFEVLDSSSVSAEDNELPGGAFRIYPQYKVELTLTGRFLLEDGKTIEPFIKRVRFSTTSRRAY